MYTRAKGRKPWIDCITMMHGKQMYGKNSLWYTTEKNVMLKIVPRSR